MSRAAAGCPSWVSPRPGQEMPSEWAKVTLPSTESKLVLGSMVKGFILGEKKKKNTKNERRIKLLLCRCSYSL